MAAGTKTATTIGWRPVEAVAVGDRVPAFDAGLQEVVAIERFAFNLDLPWALWPLRVPVGALGNQAQMILPTEQPVVLEDDCPEELFGDPFAQVPAAALEGFRGIERVSPVEIGDVATLHFNEDQVVFANFGALFFCSSHRSNGLERLLSEASEFACAALSLEVAECLVDLISIEEATTQAA